MPPITVMIKPASGNCNMRCRYCFYADEQANRQNGSYGIMTQDTMRCLVERAVDYAERVCTFVFQGGEPTLAGLDFFRAFTGYAAERAEGRRLELRYALQTNGYALTEEWARFFAENRFLIGVSLDGTKEIRDGYRRDAAGKGTHRRVMASIGLLEKYKVEYNILTVITGQSARRGQKIYSYFKQEGFRYHQYIECLDPLNEAPGGHEYSLTPEKLEQFLKSTFDAWYRDISAGRYISNRYFDNLLLMLHGCEPESCNMRGVCGNQWVAEADGSMYPCDFYALDAWRLGNVRENTFEEMERRRGELGFIRQSMAVPDSCRTCRWGALCRNGCRRLRNLDGDGKNYFCSAYQGFFDYAYPRLAELAGRGAGRPA